MNNRCHSLLLTLRRRRARLGRCAVARSSCQNWRLIKLTRTRAAEVRRSAPRCLPSPWSQSHTFGMSFSCRISPYTHIFKKSCVAFRGSRADNPSRLSRGGDDQLEPVIGHFAGCVWGSSDLSRVRSSGRARALPSCANRVPLPGCSALDPHPMAGWTAARSPCDASRIGVQTMTDKDERLVELAKRLRNEALTTTEQRNSELDTARCMSCRWDSSPRTS